jgi:iron-sulfur cluster repair protein YtfE (RIC family)
VVNLIDALLAEHGVFYVLFDQLEESASKAETAAEVRNAVGMLTTALMSHAHIENELLFSALEERLGPAGPLAVMRAEHDELDRTLQEAAKAEQLSEIVNKVLHALQLARVHFSKEEQVLFQMARQILGDDALVGLGRRWADVRRVAIAQGAEPPPALRSSRLVEKSP